MKIVSLTAENFKRLKAVEITPDGTTVVIAGRNAQGKSSVLDSIWAALGGKGGAVQRPVRDGEKKASVTLDLGDMVVTRKWSGERTTLEVAAKSGAKFPSPQKMLDELVGRLSFDPLAFALEEPKKQLATLIDLADLPFDPDLLASQRRAAYEERTIVNRDVKSLKARMDALEVDADTPVEPVDVAALVDERATAQKRAQLLVDHKRIAGEIKGLELKILELREESAAIVAEGRALPATRPVEEIVQLLASADEINAQVRERQEYERIGMDLANAESAADGLSAVIEDLDDMKSRGLAAAKLPIAGLSFDDEGVLYNDVPFSQASAAERLRVSVAMAMALNPKARIILIRDGSLLDSENLALIESMAAEQDFQVWIERVDESGEIGVVIEDGEVKA